LHSYICIVAFHLGTIDEPREGCDVGVKPEDGEWWKRLEDGRMDSVVHDQGRCSPSNYLLTNTDLVLISGGTSEVVADVMYGLHHDVWFRR